MKKTIAELTIAQFVELICGDTTVLLSKHEIPNPTALALAMRDIILEYKSIANPGGLGAFFTRIEELIKARISALVLSMCNNLTILNEYAHVRDVLEEFGISTISKNDKRLAIEVRARLARAKRNIEQIENDIAADHELQEQDIRRGFDKQTAAMMAHYKFQIDTRSMQATIYAHLVERFSAEIKAQKDAMRKR